MDTQLFVWLNGLIGHSNFFDEAVYFCAQLLPLVAIGGILGWLYMADVGWRQKAHIFFVSAFSILLSLYGVVGSIQFLYQRPRPFLALASNHLFDIATPSFPSSHATFFFALATAIYFHNKTWGIGFFILAALVSIARVIAGVHYPLDVVAGAAIGIIVASCVAMGARKWWPIHMVH